MDIYGLIASAIPPGTTTLRINVGWFTHPTIGTAFLTRDYDYSLTDSVVTADYIEADLRRQAEIIADGLARKQQIDARLGAVAGVRVKLT